MYSPTLVTLSLFSMSKSKIHEHMTRMHFVSSSVVYILYPCEPNAYRKRKEVLPIMGWTRFELKAGFSIIRQLSAPAVA